MIVTRETISRINGTNWMLVCAELLATFYYLLSSSILGGSFSVSLAKTFRSIAIYQYVRLIALKENATRFSVQTEIYEGSSFFFSD